jgi:hypothetical protein
VCFGFRKKLTPKSQVALVAFSIELKAQQAGAFFRVLFSFKELLGSTAFFIKEKVRNKILLRKRLQEFVLLHDPANISSPKLSDVCV